MALARLQVNVGKKEKALPHAEYICRLGKYKSKAVNEIMEHQSSGNMPSFAKTDPLILWRSADNYERVNGTTYREHEISLPRELNSQQRIDLVESWVKEEIGTMAYQYAIHNKKGMDGKEQPHVHLMFCERLDDDIERNKDRFFKRYNTNSPQLGGRRKGNTGKSAKIRKEELKALRARWEVMCNHHLKMCGVDERIDMRTLKEQGIEREAINYSRQDMLNPAVVAEYQHSLELKSQAQALQVEAVRLIEKMNQEKNEDELIHRLIERTERIVSSNKQQQAATDRDIKRTDSIINSRRAAATEITQTAARQESYIRRNNEGITVIGDCSHELAPYREGKNAVIDRNTTRVGTLPATINGRKQNIQQADHAIGLNTKRAEDINRAITHRTDKRKRDRDRFRRLNEYNARFIAKQRQRNNELAAEAERSREFDEGVRDRASYVDRAHKKLELANKTRCYHLFMRNHWKLKVDETIEDNPNRFTHRQYALLVGFAQKFGVDNQELTKNDLVKRITMDDWKDHPEVESVVVDPIKERAAFDERAKEFFVCKGELDADNALYEQELLNEVRPRYAHSPDSSAIGTRVFLLSIRYLQRLKAFVDSKAQGEISQESCYKANEKMMQLCKPIAENADKSYSWLNSVKGSGYYDKYKQVIHDSLQWFNDRFGSKLKDVDKRKVTFAMRMVDKKDDVVQSEPERKSPSRRRR